MNEILLNYEEAKQLFGSFDYRKTAILQRGLFDAYSEGSQEWIVLKPCYIWSVSINRCICIPAGFVTDFASIPRIFRPLFTGHGRTRYPALAHDILYAIAGSELSSLSRKHADLVLKDLCEVVGMQKRRVFAVFYAVRLGGFIAWSKKTKDFSFVTPDVFEKYRNYHSELFA